MNEPKKPYRPPVMQSMLGAVMPENAARPETSNHPAGAWPLVTWAIVVGALAIGSCGGALGSALAFLIAGAKP
jgi:hypothetical protein